MPVPNEVYDKLYRAIDAKQEIFVARLAEAVAFPSISAEPAHRDDIVDMTKWTKKHLEALGVRTELVDAGIQENSNGLRLPPVLFGTLGSDPKKKTLLVYGHLDVQPATKEEWGTDPFVLTEKDGKLHGRGSTDDKGPVLGWINAIETMQQLKIELPLNIKFCFEGMEEEGSTGLPDVLKRRNADFLADVDYICISDNYWLGKEKPCLTYGLRGICYYKLEISCAKQDLHSGTFGGAVHEALNDLVWILSQLTDAEGNIKVALPFAVPPWNRGSGVAAGNQDHHPRQGHWKVLHSPRAQHDAGGDEPPRAQVPQRPLGHARQPQHLQELTGKSVLLLPIGASDDGQHSQYERINRSNYINGTKTLASYILELAQ